MEIAPGFERAWEYANHFMYKVVKDVDHLEVFLRDLKKFNDEEKEFLREAWFVINTGACSHVNDVVEEVEEVVVEEVKEPVKPVRKPYYGKKKKR